MKRLIVCCDGTWNQADQARDGDPCPTNVLSIACRIAKRDPGDTTVSQVLFYDQGVGTGNALDRFSGGAFGRGLADNIFDAYRFLVANYERGDQIFLLGFSRGAFTARSLAGLIRTCGILKRTSVRSYAEALQVYQTRGEGGPDHDRALDFRRAHSIVGGDELPIWFIGVWDTVGALGIPLRGLRGLTRRKYQFHDVELSSRVRHAYHALAIDERRAPFEPTLWVKQTAEAGQTVEQRWFCGAHSDVGGGYAERGLSDRALEWMIEKAEGAGLRFDADVMRDLPLGPDHRGELHDSKKGLYKLTPGIDRPIGLRPKDPKKPGGDQEPDPTQVLDESVLRRWDEDPDYRPPRLREYFRRQGDPRGDG